MGCLRFNYKFQTQGWEYHFSTRTREFNLKCQGVVQNVREIDFQNRKCGEDHRQVEIHCAINLTILTQ